MKDMVYSFSTEKDLTTNSHETARNQGHEFWVFRFVLFRVKRVVPACAVENE